MLIDDILIENCDEYRKALKFWCSIGCDSVFVAHEYPPPAQSITQKPIGSPDCGFNPIISPKGDVFPCCGGSEDIVIGNILVNEDVFNSKAAINLYKALKTPNEIMLPKECNTCQYNGFPKRYVENYFFPNLDGMENKFKMEGFTNFRENTKNKQVILFGCGEKAKNLILLSRKYNINVSEIIDNDFWKWGDNIDGIPILGLDCLFDRNLSETILCICTRDVTDALDLFNTYGFESIYAYALFFEEIAKQYPVFSHSFAFK